MFADGAVPVSVMLAGAGSRTKKPEIADEVGPATCTYQASPDAVEADLLDDGENVPAPAPDVPPIAAPFVHRGQYIGCFVGLAAAGAAIPGNPETATNLRDAHIRGELWTMVRDGLVYVFRAASSAATST